MDRKTSIAGVSIVLLSLVCLPMAGAQTRLQPSTDPPKKSEPTLGPKRSDRAPDFALKSVDGEVVHLSDFRGRTVLLHFWATWCGPCRIVMPWFIDLQNKYSAGGLQVIGIALDDDATPVEIGEFADGLRVNYVVLIGSPETADSYGGIPMMPVTFVIDRDGKVADKLIGVNERSAFEKSVRSALSSASLRAEDQSLSDESTLPKKQ